MAVLVKIQRLQDVSVLRQRCDRKNCLIGGGVGVTGHVTIATMCSNWRYCGDKPYAFGVYSSGVGVLVTNRECVMARVHIWIN